MVAAVTAEFQEQIRENGHCLEVALSPDCPVARGDREALGRALWNLLDTAVKYAPDNPRIVVATARLGTQVVINVQDFGLGIEPAGQKEIFRKFVRGSNTRGRAIKGTGLGLALVDHIVRAHGGEIRMDSAPGRGSTFTIVLPGTLRNE